MADLSEVTEQIRQRVSAAAPLGKSYKLDFGGDGKILIDGGSVSNDDGAADCTIHMSFDDFLSLAKGQLDPMGAYMSGKMKIDGDMSVAMALSQLIG